MIKANTVKGTRDFSTTEMIRRNYIFDTIKTVFVRYGYLPIETPAMENLSTLMGKYGLEGDRLLFKILNSGNYLEEVQNSTLETGNYKELTPRIAEKGLRYDLTVPFARYVVQHRNDINFPFKRYQIQPVWRADKPQKGRYREFFQCDADVIGSDSLLNEVELTQIISDVFEKLNIPVIIKINNRKILIGISEVIGEQDKFKEITVSIDKLDKIGKDKVIIEFKDKGLSQSAINHLNTIIELSGEASNKIDFLSKFLKNSATGLKGVEEINIVFDHLKELKVSSNVEFDPTLARGLDYYTGTTFEVSAKDIKIGSICGGGRYDDLTGIFGLPDISGVGISFGADRIYDVILESNKFPEESGANTKLMFVNFGNEEEKHCLLLLDKVRKEGINAEIYPSATKMKKQMTYADRKAIPYVILIGSEEIKSGQYTLKNMKTGDQQKLSFEKILNKLK